MWSILYSILYTLKNWLEIDRVMVIYCVLCALTDNEQISVTSRFDTTQCSESNSTASDRKWGRFWSVIIWYGNSTVRTATKLKIATEYSSSNCEPTSADGSGNLTKFENTFAVINVLLLVKLLTKKMLIKLVLWCGRILQNKKCSALYKQVGHIFITDNTCSILCYLIKWII